MRFIRPLAVLVLALFIVSTAVGCGTDEKAERAAVAAKEKAEQDRRDRAELSKLKAEHAEKLDEARAAATTCQEQMGDLVDSLGELNSRLDIGLNYEEYTETVGKVKATYDDIDWDVNDGDEPAEAMKCIADVGLPAEKALNQYAKAAGTWDECFDDFDCSNDSIQPSLQKRWSSASRNVDKAEKGLDDLEEAVDELEADEPTLEDVRSSPGRDDTSTTETTPEPA